MKKSYESQLYTLFGRPVTLKQLSEKTGIKYGTLYARLNRSGYPLDHALYPVNNLHKYRISSKGPSVKPQ